MSNSQRFQPQRVVAFATRHGKHNLVADLFYNKLGLRVIQADIDTDELGTFSGEVERKSGPIETAREKARRGMIITSSLVGVASEGSIGQHPYLPFFVADTECMVFIDDVAEIEVTETYVSTDIVAVKEVITSDRKLQEICQRADLPRHAVIVRNGDDPVLFVKKGLRTFAEVYSAINLMRQSLPNHNPVIETDFRAMHSPSRQKNIYQCAEKLVTRIMTLCNQCLSPGWGRKGYEYGLPCSECGLTNPQVIRAERYGCVKCDHEKVIYVKKESITPAQCNWCNP